MALHPAECRIAIFRRDRREHAAMRAHDLAAHVRRIEAPAFGRRLHRVGDGIEECDQEFVAARAHDRAVPHQIEPHMLGDVVGDAIELLVDARHLGEIAILPVDRRERRGGRLDRFARFEQGLETHAVAAHEQLERARDGFPSGPAHLRAAIAAGARQHQPFGLEHAQRLAHRGAAQARLRDQFTFGGKRRTLGKPRGEDHLAQPRGEHVRCLGHTTTAARSSDTRTSSLTQALLRRLPGD